MLCGIHTFQSLPVELLDPVKNPDDVDDEEEEEEEDVEDEDDVDVLLEKDEENHPVFPVVLAPAMVEAVVWFFWAAATLSMVLSSVLNTDNVPWPRRFGPIIFDDTM